jgi:4-aminobutyrate aminotransferase / (S)-3-amino-2-methylpropionate transaminase / 5-aminovalerate transaminase
MKYARIRTPIPGPESVRCFDEEQRYIAPGIQSIALYTRIAIQRGEGAIVEDVDGNRFIDFFAGVGVASVGHAHPKWVRAIQDQAAQISVGSFATRHRTELCKLLVELAPGDVNRVQFYSSGAEAVEAALRLAKSYTKKTEFMGFWGGFHGKTAGVLGLLGDDFKHGLGPMTPGRFLTPYANCYRCALDHTFPDCNFACVGFLKTKVAIETTNHLAGVVIEPIQGTAGNIVPPAGYLQQIQATARDMKALLIADETITGFGRTGKMFACEYEGVVPDIMIIGKGFGSGYPITGIMAREEVAFSPPFANASGSSSSFGGNPLAVAAALAAVRIIQEEELVENSRRVGEYMLERLQTFKQRYPFVGEVRGRGLMIGIELVADRTTRQKLDKKFSRMIFDECVKRGLIVMAYQPSIRIQPPLVLTQEMAEEGVQILTEAFDAIGDQIVAQIPGR